MKIYKVHVEHLDMEGKYVTNREDFFFTELFRAFECYTHHKKNNWIYLPDDGPQEIQIDNWKAPVKEKLAISITKYEVWHIDEEDNGNSRVIESFDEKKDADLYAKGLSRGYDICRGSMFSVEVKKNIIKVQ